VFNATFNNISVVSWPPGLVVEEAGVPGENHRPIILSHSKLDYKPISDNLETKKKTRKTI
jgi:hypothetical protein